MVLWVNLKAVESYLQEASDRQKGAAKILTGQKVIKFFGTDKPKWIQSCSWGVL